MINMIATSSTNALTFTQRFFITGQIDFGVMALYRRYSIVRHKELNVVGRQKSSQTFFWREQWNTLFESDQQ